MKSERLNQLIDSFRNGRKLFNTSVLFNHVIHALHSGATKESVIMDVIEAHDQQSEVFKQHLEYTTSVAPKGYMIIEEHQRVVPFDDVELPEIWPLTIVFDRYGGTYSGAQYTAWNKFSEAIHHDVCGGDIACANFWDSYCGLVGKGSTPNAALFDLHRQMNDED